MCICQLVSRHMNIKKAITLECKRAKRKRTEANPESKNKSAICVRSLQPHSRALGLLVSFPHSRSLLLCCYSLTLQVIQCLLAHTRADTRNRSLWNQQFAMASQEFHERQCSAFVLFFFSSWKMHRNETGDCRKKTLVLQHVRNTEKKAPFLSTSVVQLSCSYVNPFLKVQFSA